jgi:hypothetical protein
MAARLLLLFVVMLVCAALYGCAQEAAKDRQPIKRVKEPTTAEIAPHAPEESGDHVRRAKKAGVVVHAGNSEVVARAGEAVVRVGGFKTARVEGADATAPSGKVTLKIEGSPGAEFSGTCSVGDNENKINGEVPKTFTYEPDGQRLSCEIRKHNSDSGALKVMFTAGGHTNSVQQTSAEGGAITLRYDSDGGANLSLTTSGSGGLANSSSHVSVSQSNATSERNSH